MLKGRFALLFAMCMLLVHPVLAGEKMSLPDDLRRLIPADAVAIVAVKSVAAVDQMVAKVAAQFPDEENSMPSLVEMLSDQMPALLDYLDTTKPLAVAVGMPNLMMGGMPDLTYILPLQRGVAVDDSLGAQWGFPEQIQSGQYLALSSAAVQAPAEELSDLSDHLAAGTASATLDISRLYEEFGAFLEMGLAGIPVRATGTEPDSTDAMSIEEAEVVKELLRSSVASLSRFDLSLDLSGDEISVYAGLAVVPGSVLDPGPQPEFGRALALTRALPNEADFLQVTAMDYTFLMDTFRDYYLMVAGQSMVDMEAEQRALYDTWVENYLNDLEIWTHPMATSLRLADSQMAFHGLMEMNDGPAALEQLTNTFAELSAIDMGYLVNRQSDETVAGVNFRVWEVDLDLETIESMVTDQRPPAMSGADRMEPAQMISVLRKMMSRIYIGTADGLLFLASDDDTEALAEMIEKSRKQGKPEANIARLADASGEHVQQIITGDMMAVMNWFTEWLEEMDNEEREVMKGNPVPFSAVATIFAGETGVTFKTDMAALSGLMRAFVELDEAVQADDQPAGE